MEEKYTREGACPHAPENIMTAAADSRPPMARGDTRSPVRKHPSHNSVHEQGFRSTILFVTVCVEGRVPILANEWMLKIILEAWENAQNWLVGRYVMMPDHIHFFCAPATYPAPDFHKWMKYWKRLTQQVFAARGDTRLPVAKLWQDGCWDTQMRTGAQYEEKWQYVRNNPVRKGLITMVDDWPYQGVIHDLPWHN